MTYIHLQRNIMLSHGGCQLFFFYCIIFSSSIISFDNLLYNLIPILITSSLRSIRSTKLNTFATTHGIHASDKTVRSNNQGLLLLRYHDTRLAYLTCSLELQQEPDTMPISQKNKTPFILARKSVIHHGRMLLLHVP
jgi:hypothetical protein